MSTFPTTLIEQALLRHSPLRQRTAQRTERQVPVYAPSGEIDVVYRAALRKISQGQGTASLSQGTIAALVDEGLAEMVLDEWSPGQCNHIMIPILTNAGLKMLDAHMARSGSRRKVSV